MYQFWPEACTNQLVKYQVGYLTQYSSEVEEFPAKDTHAVARLSGGEISAVCVFVTSL